jgi:hypothetical protein
MLSLLAALAGLLAAQVQAVECSFEHMDNSAISVPVVGPGLSTAGEDAPVGKVLYKGSYSAAYLDNHFTCAAELGDSYTFNVGYDIKVISTPSGAATTSGGKDVFPTNVEGIGDCFLYLHGTIFCNHASLLDAVFPLLNVIHCG